MAEKLPPHEALELYRRKHIREYLENLKEKRPIKVGDFATTLNGPFDLRGLFVLKKNPEGKVLVAPEPDAEPIEFYESELWHFEDFHDAFKEALKKDPYPALE